LDYSERSLVLTANQLLGEQWSVGARYRVSHAELDSNFPEVPDGILFSNFAPRQNIEGLLHEVDLSAIFNHRTGIYGALEARYYSQNNRGDLSALPGDNFWQFNAFVGYWFPHRQAQVQLGLLNIFDQDYRLHPLNLHANLPRERTLSLRFRLSF
jgi:outer membrane receptor for ferric coprogen and ferric-rhodotorulic acid